MSTPMSTQSTPVLFPERVKLQQSLNCRSPPQWLTPALLEAHLTEFVDQLEDRVVAELPAATWLELTKTS